MRLDWLVYMYIDFTKIINVYMGPKKWHILINWNLSNFVSGKDSMLSCLKQKRTKINIKKWVSFLQNKGGVPKSRDRSRHSKIWSRGKYSLRSFVNIHRRYIDQLQPKGVMFSYKTIFVEVHLEKGFLTTILLTFYN